MKITFIHSDPASERLPAFEILKRQLEAGGVHQGNSAAELAASDVAVLVDYEKSRWELFQGLAAEKTRIFIATSHPFVNRASHTRGVSLGREWAAIYTWNRAWRNEQIFYYDLPLSTAEVFSHTPPASLPGKPVGLQGSFGFKKGLAEEGEVFLRSLHAQGLLGSYRQLSSLATHQPQLIFPVSAPFTLVLDDHYYRGYLNPIYGLSIMAGMPVIYFGDNEAARAAYPGTGVMLKALTPEAYREAEFTIRETWPSLLRAVKAAQENEQARLAQFGEGFLALLGKIGVKVAG